MGKKFETKFIVIPEQKTVIAIGENTKAKAVCQGNDVYDVEFGKQLAEKKMWLKKFEKDYRNLCKRETAIETTIDQLCEYLDKTQNKMMFVGDKIEELEDEIFVMSNPDCD